MELSYPPQSQESPTSLVTDFTLVVQIINRLLVSDADPLLQADRAEPNANPFVCPSDWKDRVVIGSKACSTAIQLIESTIRDVDALRNSLVPALATAWQQLHLHSSLLAPIRALPVEILQLIFVYAHQGTSRSWKTPVVAQVCRFWREVAEDVPQLWTTINIDVAVLAVSEDQVREAKKWILLAKGRGVSLTIRRKHNPSPCELTTKNDFRRQSDCVSTFLLENPVAFTSIHIFWRSGTVLDSLLATSKAGVAAISFPRVKTFVLDDDYKNAGTLCSLCPNLLALRLPQPPSKGLNLVPWERIREFKGVLTEEGLSEFRSRCLSISEAEIRSDEWASSNLAEKANAKYFSFQNLTSLSLSASYSELVVDPAHYPRLPALRHLILWCEGLQAAPRGTLSRLLRAWGSTLEYLALVLEITALELKEVLDATPILKGLRIFCDRPVPTNLLSLIPHVMHLEFHANVSEKDADHVRRLLTRLIKPTTRRMASQLKSVAFYHSGRGYHRDDWRYEERPTDNAKVSWKGLIDDMGRIGLRAHDYRSHDSHRRPSGIRFDTDYFKDKDPGLPHTFHSL